MEIGESPYRDGYRGGPSRGYLGVVTARHPFSIEMICIAAGVAAVGALLFMSLTGYTERITVAGIVVPESGLVHISAPISGVGNVLVADGDSVVEGQVIATVSNPWLSIADPADSGELTKLAGSRANEVMRGFQERARELESQIAAVADRSRQQRAERAHILAAIDLRRQQISNLGVTQEKLDQLRGKQYASELQVSQHRDVVLEKKLALKALERDLLRIESEIAASRHEGTSIAASLAALRSSAAEADLRSREDIIQARFREGISIPSPVSGRVSSVGTSVGQQVAAGQHLATIIPAGVPLEVQLFADSRAIAQIQVGDTVLLRYDAFPYQSFGQFSGIVTEKASSPTPQSIEREGVSEGFKVAVSLKESGVAERPYGVDLVPGMTLSADILGEKRSWIGWLVGRGTASGDQGTGGRR